MDIPVFSGTHADLCLLCKAFATSTQHIKGMVADTLGEESNGRCLSEDVLPYKMIGLLMIILKFNPSSFMTIIFFFFQLVLA